jgi:hypothetical protein
MEKSVRAKRRIDIDAGDIIFDANRTTVAIITTEITKTLNWGRVNFSKIDARVGG